MGKFPFKVAIIYAVFAAAWIALSDRLIIHLFPTTYSQVMTVKGWGFVVVTAILLFVLLQREMERRNTTENRLRESEQRLHATFEQAAIGIVHAAPDGRFLRVNDAYCAILGHTRDDLLQRRFHDVVDPADLDGIQRDVDRMLAGKTRAFNQEMRHRRADGSTVWSHLSTSLVRNAAGEPDYIIATIDDITARRETQTILERERRFIQTVLHSVSDGVIVCDAKGTITLCNQALRAFHGQDPNEPPSSFDPKRVCRDLRLPPDDIVPSPEELPLYRALAGEAIHNLELTVTPENAPARRVLASAEPMRDDDGTILGAVTVVRDISERVRAEASRRETEARLRAVMDNAPVAIVLKDTAGRFLMANPAFRAIHGMSAEEAVGKTSLDVNGPMIAAETARQERLLLENGQVVASETVRNHVDLGPRTYMILRFPVKAEDGVVVGIGSVGLDVTEQKAAERALAASERRLDLALRAANDGLWDWDLTTDQIFLSERYRAILGYGPNGLPGTYAALLDHVHPDDLDRVEEDIARLQTSTHDRFESEFRMRHRDGHYVDIASRGYLVRDKAGRPVRLTGTLTDITELRTVQAQLAQAYKLRAIGQMAGGTAHDFNNLLQVIQTCLELAVQETDDGDIHRVLDHALQATRRGGRLTQQLLAFSRKQSLRPEIVRPARLITGMLDLIHRTLGEDIEIEPRIADDLPPVAIDAHGLGNAILNVAINARAAMPAGGRLTVRATLQRLEDDIPTEDSSLPAGDYVEIALTDTGCGMPQEVLDHAFEPFFTTREIGQGSGLGLSMVYGFAKQSGGHAMLDSTPGHGTTVTLLLPAATVPA